MRIGTPSSSTRDCNGHATRYPALYLDRSRSAVQFALSNDIDCWGVGLLNASLNHLQPDHPYAIRFVHNTSHVRITADDRTIFDGARRGVTPSHMLGSMAAVMISDSVDHAANVTLSDIVIRSYDDILSDAPTPSPTRQPTFELLRADITIEVLYSEDENENELMHPKMLESVFSSLFPDSNWTVVTVAKVEIDADEFNVTVSAAVRGYAALEELVAFMDSNLTVDVVQHALPENAADVEIAAVHHELLIGGDVITSGESILTTPSPTEAIPDAWEETMDALPFGHLAVYILMAAMVLFACSALISILTICYFCRMRKGGWKYGYKRTHRLDGVRARRGAHRRTTTDQFESECEDGDGPEMSRETNGTQTNGSTLAVLSPLGQRGCPQRPQYERVHSDRVDRVGTIDEDEQMVLGNNEFVFAMPTLDDKVEMGGVGGGTLDELAAMSEVMVQQSRMRSALMHRQLGNTSDGRLAEACEVEEHEMDCEETSDEETMDEEEEDASDEAMYEEGFDDEPCGTRTNTMDTTFCGASGGQGASSRHLF